MSLPSHPSFHPIALHPSLPSTKSATTPPTTGHTSPLPPTATTKFPNRGCLSITTPPSRVSARHTNRAWENGRAARCGSVSLSTPRTRASASTGICALANGTEAYVYVDVFATGLIVEHIKGDLLRFTILERYVRDPARPRHNLRLEIEEQGGIRARG
ncbi:hypothetical protein SNOG_14484 [Parastagonospora nodorum SN15]|uniref:Uncharacterized protein n=1 Tax=Phaeosphaeria nodorum (strain SN15 / ATCC MYA-4574 / FGSC 10173) TaxID=321614 RepID=Q0U0X4_PHANO|nr:hypothetical protein SNOG_14484 [Parastagonospora nodorum SN15]EAT78024.1 hypothetical protein SNOG_14484 [Parastagonospora nodorum SN15]